MTFVGKNCPCWSTVILYEMVRLLVLLDHVVAGGGLWLYGVDILQKWTWPRCGLIGIV